MGKSTGYGKTDGIQKTARILNEVAFSSWIIEKIERNVAKAKLNQHN